LANEDKNLHFDLSPAGVEVLLRACAKYRTTLPIYLQSSQEEVKLLDDMAERLRELQQATEEE
jgi:hypothetical protein